MAPAPVNRQRTGASAHIALCAALALAAAPTFAAEPLPPATDCWTGTYDTQRSGPVRERRTSTDKTRFTMSYDGDFAWHGKSETRAVNSVYVFCFRERLEDGGVLYVDGKPSEMDRVGSSKRPVGLHDTGFSSVDSSRDEQDEPALYGIFTGPNLPQTSVEIQLNRLRGTSAVVVGRMEGKRRSVIYMTGKAVRSDAPQATLATPAASEPEATRPAD